MTCSICLLEFKDEKSLDLHKKDHLDKTERIIMPTIQCTICKIKFTEKTKFENHLLEESHLNSSLFRPRVKIEISNEANTLLENLNKEKDFQILKPTASDSDTNVDFKASKRLTESKKIVSPRWHYQCPLCQNSLKHNSEAFNVHIKLHRTLSRNVCKFCLQEFSGEEALMEHSKENHKDKFYHCPYGDFTSPNHSAVLLHFDLSNHASLASPEVEAVEVVKFENKSYGQDNMLDVHRTLESGLGMEELEEFDVLEEQLDVKENLLIKHEKSENHLLDQNPAARKKAGRARNMFSTTYKSKEEKECQVRLQS